MMGTLLPQRDFERLVLGSRLFCKTHNCLVGVVAVEKEQARLLCGCSRPIGTAEPKSHRFVPSNGERMAPQIEIESADVILSDSLFEDEQPKARKKRSR
jgi:hypothetical protein